MSDRSGARMTGKVFEALAECFDTATAAGHILGAAVIAEAAQHVYAQVVLDLETDFDASEMNADEELLTLGVAFYMSAREADPDGFAEGFYDEGEQILCYPGDE